MAFSEQLVSDINPQLANEIKNAKIANKTFKELRKNHYRKGFVYK